MKLDSTGQIWKRTKTVGRPCRTEHLHLYYKVTFFFSFYDFSETAVHFAEHYWMFISFFFFFPHLGLILTAVKFSLWRRVQRSDTDRVAVAAVLVSRYFILNILCPVQVVVPVAVDQAPSVPPCTQTHGKRRGPTPP